MKTTKKVLCLAIILVMTLGMMPIAGANRFTDSEKITYIEAVDVLAGIGVLDGFEEGDFRPQQLVTRAEAAIIITRLFLGRKAADTLPDNPTGFTDVDGKGYNWALKYIGYCVTKGIIIGYNKTTYGPSDPVTSTQFAVMLMRALKIGDSSLFIGPDWEKYATIMGTDNNILDTNVGYKLPATREQTAKYAFNGLLYSPSGQTSDKLVTAVEYRELKKIEVGDPPQTVTVYELGYSQIDVAVIAPDSLAATLYPTLQKNNKGADDLGRPGIVWTYGAPARTIHRSSLHPIVTFNANISQGDIFKAIGEDIIIPTIVNGAGGQTSTTLKSSPNSTASAGTGFYTPNNGRGVITEIYEVGDDYQAVVIKPGFDKASVAASPATGEGAYTSFTVGGQSGKIYATSDGDTGNFDTAAVEGTVADGDYVLYYKGKDILYIEAVNTITGIVSSATSDSVYTIGTVKASKAAAFTAIGGLEPTVSNKEHTFYVDSFGNILGVKGSEGAPAEVQLALVIGFDSKTTSSGGTLTTTYTARIVDVKGVASSVPISEAMFVETGRDAKYRGVVCGYTVGASGLYTFTAPAPTSADYLIDRGISGIRQKSSDLSGGKDIRLANSETVFIVVSYSGSGGSRSPDGSVATYKGISQVPSFNLLTRTTAVSLKMGSSAPDEIAEIIFIYDDVFNTVKEYLVFVTGTWTQVTDGFTVDVIVKGLRASVRAKDETERDKLTVLAGSLLKEVSVDSDGIVTPGDLWDDEWDAENSIRNLDGLLELDGNVPGFTVADDVPVYTITIPASGSENATVSTKSAISLKTAVTLAAKDFAYILEADDTVIAIYILINKT